MRAVHHVRVLLLGVAGVVDGRAAGHEPVDGGGRPETPPGRDDDRGHERRVADGEQRHGPRGREPPTAVDTAVDGSRRRVARARAVPPCEARVALAKREVPPSAVRLAARSANAARSRVDPLGHGAHARHDVDENPYASLVFARSDGPKVVREET